MEKGTRDTSRKARNTGKERKPGQTALATTASGVTTKQMATES